MNGNILSREGGSSSLGMLLGILAMVMVLACMFMSASAQPDPRVQLSAIVNEEMAKMAQPNQFVPGPIPSHTTYPSPSRQPMPNPNAYGQYGSVPANEQAGPAGAAAPSAPSMPSDQPSAPPNFGKVTVVRVEAPLGDVTAQGRKQLYKLTVQNSDSYIHRFSAQVVLTYAQSQVVRRINMGTLVAEPNTVCTYNGEIIVDQSVTAGPDKAEATLTPQESAESDLRVVR